MSRMLNATARDAGVFKPSPAPTVCCAVPALLSHTYQTLPHDVLLKFGEQPNEMQYHSGTKMCGRHRECLMSTDGTLLACPVIPIQC